jgi:hypothetical protein
MPMKSCESRDVRVATPTATVHSMHARGGRGRGAVGRGELRSPLVILDSNSPRVEANAGSGRGGGMEAGTRGGKVTGARGEGMKPRSRLARSRSARADDDAFAPVLSFEEVLRGIGAVDALDETQRKALEGIYEESLEARSLRVVLENVKDSELELAHEEAKRRDAWAKSLESMIESRWEQRVKEVEKENATLRLEAHRREMSRVATEEELKRVSRLASDAPTAAPAPTPTTPAMVDATVEATDDTAMLAHREEIAELNKKLRAVEVRAEQEARQHELEFNALNDELSAVKETSVRRLQQELAEAKDRAAFYERCSNTADERANNAEATAHALREEFLIVEAEAKSLKSQMLRNAKSAVEEKGSIMCALAAAQARASEAENAPLAQKMSLQDVFNPSEISCKCGSVETAQRLSAALADSTSRNTELQSKIADLQERLGANTSVEDVENLEKRALAAERRLEIARTAMTRYVTESQKCSPAPVVHSTIDDLTPMKHAVERWKEYSDAHPGEDARPNENASDERAETSDSEDEFDSPGNHRGVLPTPRLRARVAIRLAHGPAHKIPHGAYKCTTDEELRRRAKVMGLSTSPFSRH